MAIQPIDLQTLYTQLEKVGKTQLHQQAALQADREAEMAANRQDSEKKLVTVQETDAGDEKTGLVHERNGSGKQQDDNAKHSDSQTTEEKKEVIRDPDLGSHIDISG